MNRIKLVQCYHCFALADHKRPFCPYLSEPPRCPRCAQVGHSSWECVNRNYCLNCSGPHPVTAPCCPLYRHKLEEIKPDLLKELSSNTQRPQEVPTQSFPDAMNLLITSAILANGSPMTFINYILSTCQALAQTSTPTSPYPPYHNFSSNNQIPCSQVQEYSEFSHYPSRNIPLEPVITPAKEYHWEMSSQCLYGSESSLESLLFPKEEYPSDHSTNQAKAQNSTITSPCTPNDTLCLDSTQTCSQNILSDESEKHTKADESEKHTKAESTQTIPTAMTTSVAAAAADATPAVTTPAVTTPAVTTLAITTPAITNKKIKPCRGEIYAPQLSNMPDDDIHDI